LVQESSDLAPPVARGKSTPVAGGARSGRTDNQAREEMRALVQERVSRFGLMLAPIFGMFFLWRAATALTGDDSPTQAFLPWQALTTATFVGLWLTFRRGTYALLVIRCAEVTGLVIAGAAVILMAFAISYPARPDTILFFCLSCILIVRAIMVPSTALFTFLLGVLFGVPFLVSVYYLNLQHDPLIYTEAADPRLRLSAPIIAGRFTGVMGLWWIAYLVVTTATSKVIYGLQREVRDARRLGQYTLLEKLGEGGMGVVYRARHAMLRRPTAIKLLAPDRLGSDAVTRFEREVQLTARLTHPNTIRVFDYGRTADGIFYYAMEYLEGANLADVVAAAGPMPAARVIHILEQTAGALAEAHQIGLIHRDIKPANIFLTEQGGMPDVAKVLDFGLVKQLGPSDGEHADVTRENSVTGTPLYMAPEALTAPETMDGRADLYALGAVGYFLVTGQEVFTGTTTIDIFGKHLHATPVPPSERLGQPVPPDLERLLMSCLEKQPDRRPESARTLQRGLRDCGDAGAWREEDARRWMDGHAAALRARRRRYEPGTADTLAVRKAMLGRGEGSFLSRAAAAMRL
jgi:serine/threonine-protein kinase